MMKSKAFRNSIFLGAALLVVLAFQNCGGGGNGFSSGSGNSTAGVAILLVNLD